MSNRVFEILQCTLRFMSTTATLTTTTTCLDNY